VCNNFKVDVATSILFEDEAVVITPVTLPTAQDGERERVAALQTAGDDVLPNIRGAFAQEVTELRQRACSQERPAVCTSDSDCRSVGNSDNLPKKGRPELQQQ